MTGNGRRLAHRRWYLLAAFALLAGLGLMAYPASTSRADDGDIQLTVMFHGSVGGKIAPCG